MSINNIFAGVTPSPEREFIAKIAKEKEYSRYIIPCAGRFGVVETMVRAGVDPSRIYASDILLFSAIIGALSDPNQTLDDLGIDVDASLEFLLTENPEDVYEEAAGVMLAIKYCQLPPNSLYNLSIREEIVRRKAHYRRHMAARLEDMAETMQGITYRSADLWDEIEPFSQDETVFVHLSPPWYCVSPDTPILTADLRWVRADSLRVGDKLLAFDEESPANGIRRWRFSDVTESMPIMKEAARVTMEDGTSVIATLDHPWLAQTEGYTQLHWIKTQDLMKKPTNVVRLVEPWAEDRTYEGGYIAGLFDGEGTYNFGPSFSMNMAQNPGAVMNEAVRILGQHGVDTYLNSRADIDGTTNLNIKGGIPAMLRFMGIYRPHRFLEKLPETAIEERSIQSKSKPSNKRRVVSVEPMGVVPIQGLATSTATYIADGYAMHNSRGYSKMFEVSDRLISWNHPTLREWEPGEFPKLFEELAEYKSDVLVDVTRTLDVVPEGWHPIFGQAMSKGRSDYLVSNFRPQFHYAENRIKKPTAPPKWEIYHDQEITPESVSEIVPVRGEVGSYYRNMFVHRLPPSDIAGDYYLLLVDGRVVASIALNDQHLLLNRKDFIELVMGIVVSSDRYPRLSRLMSLMMVSGDTLAMLEGMEKYTYRSPTHIQTTTKTRTEDKVVSRVMDEIFREELPNGEFHIRYRGKFNTSTWDECLQQFLEYEDEESQPRQRRRRRRAMKDSWAGKKGEE